MPAQQRLDLPPAALAWLLGDRPCRVLALNPPRSIVRRLLTTSHEVIAVDADPARAALLVQRMPPGSALFSLAGRADELPVQPCSAHVVLLGSALRARPGDRPLDLHEMHTEISRALTPTGWAAGWQIVRDDTVPWVRRLIALMRSVDASAMAGQESAEHEELLASKYFPCQDRRDFRLWMPMSRDDMIALVAAQHAVAVLGESARRRLLTEAGAIFDNACGNGDLSLPYQLRCWRAHVDHAELTQPITLTDGALTIPI
ncbi:hypothetical protein GCM10009785_25510 [Brooklawnia cerclae]|uniref:Uncharacterized protein n=1 Tax=Brooklawnia cerclae TaxID=349934 RepID=A0ABX0SE32_9ACTN|nr:methyltransferase [Brooklawnia cerclae]NIH55485.1 hypothetical protein [Brooklawnia cerclae]